MGEKASPKNDGAETNRTGLAVKKRVALEDLLRMDSILFKLKNSSNPMT